MKNAFIIISIVLSISLLLCACKKTEHKDSLVMFEQSDTNNTYNSYESESITEKFVFDGFVGTENQANFLLLIEDNPIDKAYFFEETDSTTKNMTELQLKYANIWFDELHFSCENFTTFLSETDKESFKNIQKDWENYILENKNFINKIFNEKEYQVYMGSAFSIECAYEYMKCVRERTLYVKYLQFCMETNKTIDSNVDIVFNYKG